jgi:hypothetical protein
MRSHFRLGSLFDRLALSVWALVSYPPQSTICRLSGFEEDYSIRRVDLLQWEAKSVTLGLLAVASLLKQFNTTVVPRCDLQHVGISREL